MRLRHFVFYFFVLRDRTSLGEVGDPRVWGSQCPWEGCCKFEQSMLNARMVLTSQSQAATTSSNTDNICSNCNSNAHNDNYECIYRPPRPKRGTGGIARRAYCKYA